MTKTYTIKTDQIGGKLEVKPENLIEIESNSIKNAPKIAKRFSIYYKKDAKKKIEYNTILNVLFFLCLVIVILLELVFYKYFTTDLQKNFESLTSKICFAFIASYIFYNIVTKSIDRQRKIKAYAVICGILDSIISSGKQVEKLIWNGKYAEDIVNFKPACQSIDLGEIQSDKISTKADYIVYYTSTRINSDVKILFNYMPFLESEILHQINNIQNSTFSTYVNLLPILKEKNLSQFSDDIVAFLDMIYELERTNAKLKSKYLKGFEKKN